MFITVEGIEGSGKSTLIQNLQKHYQELGTEIIVTREPGGSKLGQELRKIILNQNTKICSNAELYLFLADRAQHVNDIIKPYLDQGRIIICDRYIDSTYAYQGYGRGLDLNTLKMLNMHATNNLLPNLTFLLDLNPEIGLFRAKSRNILENLTESEGRFEAEQLHFHNKIRQGFLELASFEPQRIKILDASLSPTDILENAKQILEKILI